MAAERLSKLQKWILIQAYKNKHKSGLEPFETVYPIDRRQIYEKYFNIKLERYGWPDHCRFIDSPGCKPVILCRSLKLLWQRGYWKYHYGRTIYLTDKGAEKAKELLKV